MRAVADFGPLIDLERIAFDHAQPAGKFAVELGQCGNAAPVAFDRNHGRSGVEQRPGQSARAWPDFVDRVAR